MLRNFPVLFVAAIAASPVLASAQVASPRTDTRNPASPAAFVYISDSTGSSGQIYGYTAAADGALTPITGSPFAGNVSSLVVNKEYLFGTNGIDIDSFSIASDGAVTQVFIIDAQKFNQDDCGGPSAIFLDRTGLSLYDLDYLSDCANNSYQSFGVDNSSGTLSYLGVTTAATPTFEYALNFIGNNKYAYSSSCYHWYQSIAGFARNSDGQLADLNINPAIPNAPPGSFYCPNLAAADNKNNLAIPMGPLNAQTFQPDGPTQLAVYTADNSGNLATNSSYTNMPIVAVGVGTLAISPAGNLLAVGGNGIQIFHFNGANPITKFTGPLMSEPIGQVAWDSSNHLYAISAATGKLFVFTVTTTTVKQAPGSPYSITTPGSIAVLSQN